jgi:hypothetical protein
LFGCSSQGEVWGWVVFYGGMIGVAFGSTYYHLKPDNHRVIWDTLPVSTIIFKLQQNYVGVFTDTSQLD